MSRVCPDGHASTSQDYCDICGLPMGAASAPAAPTPPPAAAPTTPAAGATPAASRQECSHCGAVNPAANLFCESCGFDFTTGALPERIPLADGTYLADPTPAKKPEPSPEPSQESSPASAPSPEPASDPDPAPSSEATPEPPREPTPAPRPAPTPPPASRPAAPKPSAVAPPPVAYEQQGNVDVHVDRPANRPPSQSVSSDWVVEVWIDPTWFALQEGEGECPSPGPPDLVALRSSGAIIGRPSAARSVRPEVDCGTDTAVSRRHARLTTDGRRWWIEDLDSSNGTFVGGAAENPPEKPIAAGRRVEVDADDRIYVGAWTRLVVRPATESDRRDLT